MAFPLLFPATGLVFVMDNNNAVSVNYRKTASNLLAVIFLAAGMAVAMYLGAFP